MKINGTPDGGGSGVIVELTATENGIYTPTTGVDGYAPVEVEVPIPSFVTEALSVTSNGIFTPGEGVDGYSQVSVNVQPLLQDLSVSVNGSYSAGEGYYGLSTVIVSVPGPVTATLSVSDNGTYTPGEGVDGYSQVIVDVPQTVAGFTEKEITEGIQIVNLSNSASSVHPYVFEKDNYLQTVNLPNCLVVNEYAFADCTNLTSVNLPECKSISAYAFQSCYNISYLSLPKCVSIGYMVFNSCSALTSVNLPECKSISGYVFASCYSISYLSLPKCEFIGTYAFLNARLISYVDLPVCSAIGQTAFNGCSNLNTFILRSTSVVGGNFYIFDHTPIADSDGKIYVPASLVDTYKTANYWSSVSNKIYPIQPDFSFSNGLVTGWASSMNSTYIETLSISANDVTGVSMDFLTDLASSTFMNHQNLSYLSLTKVTYYGDDTFAGCISLSEIELNLTSMGNRVFSGCTSLEKVIIHTDVIPIGSDVFNGCTSLSEIYVEESYYNNFITASGWSEYSSLIVSMMPILAFVDGTVYGSASYINALSITNLGVTSSQIVTVSLPNCETIESNTFYSCKNLTGVYLPECSSLSYRAFGECPKISNITLPKCEYIGEDVFRGAFQSITGTIDLNLPVCNHISRSAFYWTRHINTLTLGSNSVCVLENNAFDNAGITAIYVPASLVEDYKTAQYWSNYYASLILPISE